MIQIRYNKVRQCVEWRVFNGKHILIWNSGTLIEGVREVLVYLIRQGADFE